jgi:hypothetical protein
LRNQLMTEADADHRHLVLMSYAHERLERRDPIEIIIHTGRRACDQDRFQPLGVWQRRAGGNADSIECDGDIGRADHPLEHLRIRSVPFAVLRADDPGFDDSDARHRDRWLFEV